MGFSCYQEEGGRCEVRQEEEVERRGETEAARGNKGEAEGEVWASMERLAHGSGMVDSCWDSLWCWH